jgi:hypothetical protein
MHQELQKCFKRIYEATDSSMIEKSTVDFLEPYLALVEKQNIVE